MGLGEGGLELFVNDGALAEAVMKASERLSAEFSVRVRGDFDETRLGEVREAAAQDIDTKGHLETLEFAGGEGANRWARLEVVGVRPRDIKRIFEQCGIEANRILRTRIGPIVLDRTLARGQGRRLTDAELEELAEAVGFVRKDATPARPARAARRPGRQSVSRDPRSKPARR
jgi:23S rRNA pseudouridine2605 synthase